MAVRFTTITSNIFDMQKSIISGTALTRLSGLYLPLYLLKIGLNLLPHTSLFCVKFMSQLWYDILRGVRGFVIACLCGVSCRGVIANLLLLVRTRFNFNPYK